MIRFIDATTLALTKLRTHKIRTTITIIIPSLLFGLLVAVLIISEGAFQSISNFTQEGYGSRYMIGASPNGYDGGSVYNNATVIARAKEIYKNTIAEKKVAAKELGIIYEESSEDKPVFNYSGKADDEYLSPAAPSAVKAMAEYKLTQPKYDLDFLKTIAKPFSPISYHSLIAKTTNSGSILLMKDNKENFSSINTSNGAAVDQTSVEALISQLNGFTVADSGLTSPFMLPKSDAKITNSDAIPVIISYHAAEGMLKLTALDNNKVSKEKQLDRIKEIQSKANSINFSVCYRNSTSQQLINDAITVAANIETNKNNKNYQTPSLIYQLPTDDSCGTATIKSDTRPAEQKSYEAKLKQFNERFGLYTAPDQQKIEFQVVGLMPNAPDYSSQAVSAANLLQSLVGSSMNYGLVVPENLYTALPSADRYNKVFAESSSVYTSQPNNFVVEFASATNANKFMSRGSCEIISSECTDEKMPFWFSGYGSNSIALDSIKTSFLNIFSIAIIVVVVIAAIIMSGTLGRMVADGRRETAVFRAIGFKRIDIASIYITYILMISVLVAITALIIGSTAAYILDYIYWQEFTVQSLLTFGASDMTKQFHFFKLNYLILSSIVGAILGSGIISAILPLARNIRRNPIKDMRDE